MGDKESSSCAALEIEVVEYIINYEKKYLLHEIYIRIRMGDKLCNKGIVQDGMCL